VRSRHWIAPRRQRSARFGRSRVVRALKMVLPGLALTLLALVLAWPQIARQEARFDLSLTAVGPAGGAKPQVLNPRLIGADSQSRPFRITAVMGATRPAEDGGELYVLSRPSAEMVLSDGSVVSLEAREGTYRRAAKALRLEGNVRLGHGAGYTLSTESARVHLEGHTVTSDSPVRGEGPAGNIASEGLRVLDGGERILFTGRARMTIHDMAKAPGYRGADDRSAR